MVIHVAMVIHVHGAMVIDNTAQYSYSSLFRMDITRVGKNQIFIQLVNTSVLCASEDSSLCAYSMFWLK